MSLAGRDPAKVLKLEWFYPKIGLHRQSVIPDDKNKII